MKTSPYLKFFLMLGVSFFTMYATMFFNVAQWDHIMLSANRTYMTMLMVTPMGISMMLFMWPMYNNRVLNYCILAGATGVFIVTFILLRTQTPITDIQYMRGMIPHHSSAIMTSSHATFKDPETQALAKGIIDAQKREIAQMKAAIRRLELGR